MQTVIDSRFDRYWPKWIGMLVLLIMLPLLLSRCSPSGDSVGDTSPPDTPGPQVEQQAIENLVQLYGEATIHEDVDRLQSLLAPETPGTASQGGQPSAVRQTGDGAFVTLSAFREHLRDTFRDLTVTALAVQDTTVAPDRGSVTFIEVVSTLDPAALSQQTQVFRTTFAIERLNVGDVVNFRIGAVTRDGPLVEVMTRGLLVAGPPTPLAVRASSAAFNLSEVALHEPVAGTIQRLQAADAEAAGHFVAPPGGHLHTLQVQATSTAGETIMFDHRYRLYQTQEGIAQRVSGTADTRFFAVTVTPNGTVWAGGDGGARLYRIAPDTISAQQAGTLLEDPAGRVQDLAIDSLDRLHAIVFSPQNSGDIVFDQGVVCQTVNASDAGYPFAVLNPSDNAAQPSPSTRLLTAADGNVWLYGSDGGVGLARDNFRQGNCADDSVSVTYEPLYQRQTSSLPTNTVPAFIPAQDGALWFGTALGLVRLQDGQWTPLPFQNDLRIPDDVATLEGLLQAIAQAIFDATPLDTLTVGGLSVSDILGGRLRKEDFIFSAVQDPQGAVWAGTLGGGLRRIELIDGVPQDTLHLTRADGLSSNLILSLAIGPDHTLWVGTDEGVSRIDTSQAPPSITTLTALEGVPGPVRDIAVDPEGTVWLATDEGLFRLSARVGRNGDTQAAFAGRLIRVSGNNQNAQPGEELPAPLVVRLEDEVGKPVANATLSAQIVQGEAAFVSGATLVTNAEGEAAFRLQIGDAADDVLIEVTAVERDVPPVKFFATIGSVDTSDRPTDVTVSEATQVAFIADSDGGVPVVDVQNPAQPVLLHDGNPLDFTGVERLVEARGNRLYVVAHADLRLTIVNLTDPRAEDFTKRTLGRFSEAVRSHLDLTNDAPEGLLRDFAIGNGAVYLVKTGQAVGDAGSLDVIDIRDETRPQFVTSLELPTRQTSGVALLGDVLYVAADASGLLLYDIRDPLQPVLLTSVAGDPDPDDGITLALTSRLTIDGDFAYVVQTEFDPNTSRQTDRLLIVDLQHRTAPRVRGSLPLRVVTAEPTTPSSYTGGTGLAISGGFAYLARSALGLQVIDVRHPDAPRFVGFLDTPSQALQLTTAGDLIYVLDIVFGLQVIQGPGADLTDSDGDGLSNVDEQLAGTDPRLLDSDGDGLSDSAEVTIHGTDPLRADTDGDGLSDSAEVQVHGSDPTLADSDGDGLGDGEEIVLRLDPLNPDDAGGVVDLITNGGFEVTGDRDTPLPGWTQSNRLRLGGLYLWTDRVDQIESWLGLQTTTSPFLHMQVPAPPQGKTAAIAESASIDSVLTLRQAIDIPPAASVVLGVDVLVLSGIPFATPEGFDLVINLSSDLPLLGHQFRIDLLDLDEDPLAAGDAVLAPLFRTEEGSPPIVNYRRLLFDLTAYAGRRVVLRFTHHQEYMTMLSGIDNVRLLATGVAP